MGTARKNDLRPRRRGRLFRRLSIRFRRRYGFTLIEMAFALTIAAGFLFFTGRAITTILQSQIASRQLALARNLAMTKMIQLINSDELKPTELEGELGSDMGVYNHFKYRIIIKNEKLDLAELIEKGSMDSLKVEDQLPASVQNGDPNAKKAGQSKSTATGGEIEVIRLSVTITYPMGQKEKNYVLETYVASKDSP